MKRAAALLLILCLLLLPGCMSSSERTSREEALSALNGGSTGTYALSTGTELENTEVYNDGDTIVHVAGLTGDTDDPQLLLAIRNGTRQTLYLSVSHLAYNGWEVDGWSDVYELEPRSVTMVSVWCDTFELAQYDIDDIGTVAFDLSLYDEDYDDYASISYSGNTTAADDVDLSYTPEGIDLLDESGIRVLALDLSAGDSGDALQLYLENGTDRTVYLSCSHVRLNGEAAELWLYDNAWPDCRRIITEGIYAEDSYEELELSADDVLTFELSVCDWITGATLANVSVSLSPSDF